MISCHDGKHRNDFSTVGKHLDMHCSRCAKTCRKFLQYQSIHQREKPSNNGKEGELLRPLLVAFWRIENTQFPAVSLRAENSYTIPLGHQECSRCENNAYSKAIVAFTILVTFH